MVGFLCTLLVAPTLIDSSTHDRPVPVRNPPDKEYLDVVFNRDEFRVVDSGILRDVFVGSCHLHANWIESKSGLP